MYISIHADCNPNSYVIWAYSQSVQKPHMRHIAKASYVAHCKIRQRLSIWRMKLRSSERAAIASTMDEDLADFISTDDTCKLIASRSIDGRSGWCACFFLLANLANHPPHPGPQPFNNCWQRASLRLLPHFMRCYLHPLFTPLLHPSLHYLEKAWVARYILQTCQTFCWH